MKFQNVWKFGSIKIGKPEEMGACQDIRHWKAG